MSQKEMRVFTFRQKNRVFLALVHHLEIRLYNHFKNKKVIDYDTH